MQLLLNHDTINSDATMEHETQHQLSNSYACNNKGFLGSGVLCWVHAEAVSGESKHS
jgi:hypothetical protein